MSMVNPHTQPRHAPRLHISTEEILAHAAHARATACRDCDPATATLIGDIARLVAEVTWLYRSLTESRLRAANLEAAIRAALGAQEDGEHDPTGYLRDEITSAAGAAYGP
jgi:hypothetical protein